MDKQQDQTKLSKEIEMRELMTSRPGEGEALQDDHYAAKLLGVSVATVRRWRQRRTGPPFLRVGACVRYRHADLMAWIDTLPRGGSARSEEVAHASA